MNRNNQSAFTLIEILIALAIFSILSVVMSLGLQSILRTYDRLKIRSAQFSALEIALTLMQRDVSQVVPRLVMTQDDQPQAALWGSTTQLSMTIGGFANPNSVEQRSTLQRISYQYEGGELLRITAPVLDTVKQTEFVKKSILSHVTAFKFSYLDIHNSVRSFWPLIATQYVFLPKAVQVTMKIQGLGSVSRLFIVPGGSYD